MRVRTFQLLAGLFCAAGFCGAAFSTIGVPLAWIVGGMTGAALFVNLLGPVGETRQIRRLGQLLLGTAAATVLTHDLLRGMAGLFPFMIGAAVLANLVGFAIARPFAAISGVDRTTALLSVLPAGMAEMASLAHDRGARADVVAVTHTLRVFAVVLLVPLVVDLLATTPHAATGAMAEAGGGNRLSLVGCLVISAIISLLAGRAGMLNPWIVVPMIVGLGFVSAGVEIGKMPEPLLIAAQICIGGSLGARLLLRDFSRLPRVLVGAAVSTVVLSVVMVLILVPVLATALELDRLSLALALSPGGMGEMVASAKALDAQVAIVASFQFLRSLLTNFWAPFLIGPSRSETTANAGNS